MEFYTLTGKYNFIIHSFSGGEKITIPELDHKRPRLSELLQTCVVDTVRSGLHQSFASSVASPFLTRIFYSAYTYIFREPVRCIPTKCLAKKILLKRYNQVN